MQIQRELNGKVALVTGGGSGLGAAICRSFAESGLKTIVADLSLEKAKETARTIEVQGGKAMPVEIDVTQFEKIPLALQEMTKQFGGIDVVVNNAGIDLTVPITEMPLDKWNKIMATNLTGPFMLAKEAMKMMEKKPGTIINIVSTAAKRSWANASAYHASKWGLLGFSHALHVEAREKGIKVTAVICGGMRTPFLLERFPDLDISTLQPPENVAQVITQLLAMPQETVVPEIMVLPMKESSWP